jgi:hypothetical protein
MQPFALAPIYADKPPWRERPGSALSPEWRAIDAAAVIVGSDPRRFDGAGVPGLTA